MSLFGIHYKYAYWLIHSLRRGRERGSCMYRSKLKTTLINNAIFSQAKFQHRSLMSVASIRKMENFFLIKGLKSLRQCSRTKSKSSSSKSSIFTRNRITSVNYEVLSRKLHAFVANLFSRKKRKKRKKGKESNIPNFELCLFLKFISRIIE